LLAIPEVTGLTVTNASVSSLTLSWGQPKMNVDYYEYVFYYKSISSNDYIERFVYFDTVPENMYVLNNLMSGQIYEIKAALKWVDLVGNMTEPITGNTGRYRYNI
jgi:hypothetical protein